MIRYSKLFGKTIKNTKQGARAKSHILLHKAGYIRELSAGRYQLLPLGYKVFEKIIKLINDEMEKIGSQRITIPILQPLSIWQKTNRDKAWGNELMKITDARGSEFALSATGEGVITELIAGENLSYQDLPLRVHQFLYKFRDEKRPRSGLIRVREFTMKDAYSFDSNEDNMMKTYESFRQAYENICQKLKLPYYICQADSGALGGDFCHEFQVPCEAGEDFTVKCSNCNYLTSKEKAEFVRTSSTSNEDIKAYEEIQLPEEVKTIEDLMKHYKLPADRFLKNVVFKTSEGILIIATITGNLNVDKKKLEKIINLGELSNAEENDLTRIGAKHGYIHSWGCQDGKNKVITLIDESVLISRNLYGGFKTETTDPINVNYGRDFKADIEADIAEVFDEAICKKCQGKLNLIRTLEFGHIFKYDHFYTKHHDGFFTDKDGKKKLMYMGAYGIGIDRLMGTLVEIHHDEKGIIWPEIVSPFDIHLITIGEIEEKTVLETIKYFEKDGKTVLWDDRDISAGEKFNDADLIGISTRVVLSKKSLENGGVEVRKRGESEIKVVKI